MGHHSINPQLTIEKLMWTMSSSLGMLVAFGLSVGYPFRQSAATLHHPNNLYYLLRSPATLTQLLIHLYDQSAPSFGSIQSALRYMMEVSHQVLLRW